LIAAPLDRRRAGAASTTMMSLPRCLALVLLLDIASAAAATAAECGPDKLGTSRVVEVGTKGGLLVGLKTYPAAIPLADHEVILTFDDGPDERSTPLVLKALADQCVRATFFAIGYKLDALPLLARREVEEGHNVANHTYSHPQPTLTFMPDSAARADILKGMIAVERDAYGQSFPDGEPTDLGKLKLHAPFFRFPGFADTADLRTWFADNDVAIFGTDLWASDWIPMKPDEELKLILGRLEKARRGMLLFHDNRPWTAEMLPTFLAELKKRGYRVVHVVAGPGAGPTEPAPAGWVSETGRVTGAFKPRLDKNAAPPPGPFAVKPAPAE
jgi:peptidoglycan/xylan/chitin deacetylase (PgdA/CDA1 family)